MKILLFSYKRNMVFKFSSAKAVSYANSFSNRGNPFYFVFDEEKEGVNFASQCVLAGCDGINSQSCPDWHYINEKKYTESWVDVEKFKSYLLSKKSCGPVARIVSGRFVGVGDVVFCNDGNNKKTVGVVTKIENQKIFFVTKGKRAVENSCEFEGECDCVFLQIIAVKK